MQLDELRSDNGSRHVEPKRDTINGGSCRNITCNVKHQQPAPELRSCGGADKKILAGAVAERPGGAFIKCVVFAGWNSDLRLRRRGWREGNKKDGYDDKKKDSTLSWLHLAFPNALGFFLGLFFLSCPLMKFTSEQVIWNNVALFAQQHLADLRLLSAFEAVKINAASLGGAVEGESVALASFGLTIKQHRDFAP